MYSTCGLGDRLGVVERPRAPVVGLIGVIPDIVEIVSSFEMCESRSHDDKFDVSCLELSVLFELSSILPRRTLNTG